MSNIVTADKKRLSTKDIPPRERLIFALDVPSVEQAKQYVEQIGDAVQFYKLGLQLFMAGGYFEFVQWLHRKQKKVFVDLKFFDVPETVRLAVRQLTAYGASFATVHGNDAMLKAAAEAVNEHENDLKILAVTVLTSLDKQDLVDLGFNCDPEKLVLSRAKRAFKLGCHGVISSGLEAAALRDELSEPFLIVTPGIRPVDNIEEDDQKRTVDVRTAFLNGADYIVVGRPIRNAKDPKAKAEEIQRTIAELFS